MRIMISSFNLSLNVAGPGGLSQDFPLNLTTSAGEVRGTSPQITEMMRVPANAATQQRFYFVTVGKVGAADGKADIQRKSWTIEMNLADTAYLNALQSSAINSSWQVAILVLGNPIVILPSE